MQNWIFFPKQNKQEAFSGPESLEMLLLLLQGSSHYMITRDEWHTLFPESREKLRKPSLGFCCGDPAGENGMKRDLLQGLPPTPVRKYDPGYRILPKVWDNEFSCSIRNHWSVSGDFILQRTDHPTGITVAGMLSLEESIFVRGSRITFFSKYRLPPLPAETFIVG